MCDSGGDVGYFTWLALPGLRLQILTENDEPAKLLGGDDTLAGILDIAIDAAAYEGDLAGLVLLHRCLRKGAKEAKKAARQVAVHGPAKSSA